MMDTYTGGICSKLFCNKLFCNKLFCNKLFCNYVAHDANGSWGDDVTKVNAVPCPLTTLTNR